MTERRPRRRWVAAVLVLLLVATTIGIARWRAPHDFPLEIWVGYDPASELLPRHVRRDIDGEDLTQYDVSGSSTRLVRGTEPKIARDAINLDLVGTDRVAGSLQLARMLRVRATSQWYSRVGGEPRHADDLLWWAYRPQVTR